MKVRWSGEEQDKLYEAAITLWKSAPGISIIEAVRAVQKQVLPKERQRNLRFIQTVSPALRKRLEREIKALLEKPAEVVPPPAPVVPPKPELTPLETALNELCDSVASIMSERIVSRVRQSLGQRMEGILQVAAQQAVHEDVQRKRKVLIIGLAEYLQNPIEQEFAKLLDIRFKTPDAPMNGIIDTAKGMDFIIVTKWTPHKVSDTLVAANLKYMFVDGGVQMIKEKLTEFYVL